MLFNDMAMAKAVMRVSDPGKQKLKVNINYDMFWLYGLTFGAKSIWPHMVLMILCIHPDSFILYPGLISSDFPLSSE